MDISFVCPSLPPEEHAGGGEEAYRSLWINWNNELVEGNTIDWREELEKAQPDEGKFIDLDDTGYYFTAPRGNLPRDMAREEIRNNWQDVNKANVNEITGPYELGCFKRRPRHRSTNAIDTRWVITWKMIEGKVGIRCSLIVRGFKGKFQDLDTYAGTTSRSGRRLVNVVAVEHTNSVLFSFDVSLVFAKGMTFEELSALSGQNIRRVEFDVPRVDIGCLRELLDLKDFYPVKETLAMLKFIYGLTDAPRA